MGYAQAGGSPFPPQGYGYGPFPGMQGPQVGGGNGHFAAPGMGHGGVQFGYGPPMMHPPMMYPMGMAPMMHPSMMHPMMHPPMMYPPMMYPPMVYGQGGMGGMGMGMGVGNTVGGGEEVDEGKGVLHATTTAPVNIAVIKYWGKRDVGLMLPLNSSLSGTLNQDDMASTTSVAAVEGLEEDQLWLNGVREDIGANGRVATVIALAKEAGKVDLGTRKLLIVSENNFPTAAGLASSASGYACLVAALAQVLDVQTELSAIARRGSGSASRSMYGGWVKWEEGVEADGSDSIAVQIADETHWEDMRVVVLVANAQKKHISSSKGMQLTAKTSPMIPDRLAMLPGRMAEMEAAILARDYQTFADLTMKDSDNFHATCATTEPPIHYMSEVSHDVVKLVNAFNQAAGQLVAAYTFDAGPNAVIYLLKDQVLPFLAAALHFFPPAADADPAVYCPVPAAHATSPHPDVLRAAEDSGLVPAQGRLQYYLHTSIGDGPRVLPKSASLIDFANLGPKN